MADNEPKQCAICLDEDTDETPLTFVHLPCCGQADDTSTLHFCSSCILLLTHPTSTGRRVGRCPRCRAFLVVEHTTPSNGPSSLTIRTVERAGQCMICHQNKEHLIVDGRNVEVCDACFLGRRMPMIYECQRCHSLQRIPHPMYRYQPSPTEFGNVSWACHARCADYTNWRLHESQLGLVPIGDAPEVWDVNVLEQARARVRQLRHARQRTRRGQRQREEQKQDQEEGEEQPNAEAGSCIIS